MVAINAKFSPVKKNDGFIKRKQLLDHMYTQKDKNVILITAPGGYGKTTLLFQYQNETDENTIWYQVDKFDNNVHRFLENFIEGIRHSFLKNNIDTIQISEEYLSQYDTKGMIASILNIFLENCAEDFCIIIEDFDFIFDEKTHQIMELFLNYIPPNIRVIISSRRKINIDISHLITKNRLMEIGIEEMKFSIEEEKKYIETCELHKKVGLMDSEIIRKNNGWPFGLNLLKYATNHAINEMSSINKMVREYFDRIFHSVENKDFLLQTAMLEILDIDACNFITGQQDSDEIIRNLSDTGIYITPNHDGSYKYHDLFKEYLMDKVKDKKKIYLKIADFYIDRKNLIKSIDYLLLCKKYTQVDALIRDTNYKSISSVYYMYLMAWSSKVPDAIAKKYSSLCLIKVMFYIKIGDMKKAAKYVNTAKKLFTKTSDKEGLLKTDIANLHILRLQIRQKSKPMSKLAKIYQLSNEIYNRLSKRKLLEKIDVIIEKVHLSVLLSKTKEELKTLRTLVSEVNKDKLTPCEVELLNLYGYVNYLMGEYRCAIEIQDRYRYAVSPLNSIPYTLRIYIAWGLLERGKSLVLHEIEITKRLFLSPSLPDLYCILAEIEFHMGKYNSSERYFKEALRLYDTKQPNLYKFCIFNYGQLLIFLGRKDKGLKVMLDCYKNIGKSDVLNLMIGHMFLAKVNLILGDYHNAIFYAEKSMPTAEDFNAVLYINTLSAVIATSYISIGNEGKAYSFAERCMELSSKENYIQDFITLHEFYEPIFEFCLKYNIKKDFVEEILKRVNKKSCTFKKIPVSNLYVQYFGDNVIQTKDKMIRWRTNKAKGIFYYLLYNNKTGVTRDKLIDIFFEYYNLEKASNNLRTNITYIRKAFKEVGFKDILRYINGRYFINTDNIVTDLERFQKLIEKYRNENHLTIELCQELCDIYQGSFCEGIDVYEFIHLQQKYFEFFEKVVRNTIKYLSDMGQYNKSLHFINILIGHEKYNEDYHLMKLDIYNRMNDRLMAKKVERELQMLKEELT